MSFMVFYMRNSHDFNGDEMKIAAPSQTSIMRRIKSQNVNVSRFPLQVFLPNHLKPGVKSNMKM